MSKYKTESEELLDWADVLEMANIRNRIELPHESALVMKEETIQYLVRDLHRIAGTIRQKVGNIYYMTWTTIWNIYFAWVAITTVILLIMLFINNYTWYKEEKKRDKKQ